MTRFLLLRHADHDWIGKGVAGRMEGVGLNAHGQAQAQALVHRLRASRITAIYSSPQQRARETVQPLAQDTGLPVTIAPEFAEVDFGEWTGWTFERLRSQAAAGWQQWCEQKGSAHPPGGEAFADVPRRAWAGLERLRAAHPEGTVLVASHADVIRAVVAAILGVPLDNVERFEIAPASISVVDAAEGWTQLKLLNETGGAP